MNAGAQAPASIVSAWRCANASGAAISSRRSRSVNGIRVKAASLKSMLPDAQATQTLKSVEIAVVVQQRVAPVNAEAGDQHIDRTSDRDPDAAQAAVVIGGG